ncbi:hypothetical protein ACVV2G_23800 [Streptomyces ziwulingensis]
MVRRSDAPATPPWARPGNRWGPWLYWPMLCVSVALLVWRVIDRDGAGPILFAAGQVLVWVCLLVANRTARRRHETP